jgi:hypothetical protein
MPQYRIEYFREGTAVGLNFWSGEYEESKSVVRAGMLRHRSSFARLVDVDDSDKEVWSIKSDCAES